MGEIICTDITKVWGAGTPREVVALERVSLTVSHGEFLVIIGPSGCGKSTLLMLLAGLEMPISGTITYNGETVTGPGADRSLIFQQPSLYSADFERYRGFFVERLRAEVTKAFQEQELAEMLDTRIK